MIINKNIQGHELEINTEAKFKDAVYNKTYDLYAEYIDSKYIPTTRGTAQVRMYQIIYGCTILIDMYTGKIYTPIIEYKEV